ncbi:hypothetical protein TNCV_4317251 [Trichonephila clavipes]|nr:hypothetical protein TNCV_4317251 [Trichonephila clavipes]
MFDGLVAVAVDRWRHDCGVGRLLCTARVTNEGRIWVRIPEKAWMFVSRVRGMVPSIRMSSQEVGGRGWEVSKLGWN